VAIERFEDIRGWQEARKLAQMVHDLTGGDIFRRHFSLREQMGRAAVSAMANIAEGFDAGSDGEFARFLQYALRSTTEVQSLLYVAFDRRLVTPEGFRELYDQAVLLKSVLAGFIRYLRDGSHDRQPSQALDPRA